MTRLDDRHDRRLTAEERTARDWALPGLHALTGYLSQRGARDSYDDAVAHEAPVRIAGPDVDGVFYRPLAVFPTFALRWALTQPEHRGHPGTGRPLGIGDIMAAIDFMRIVDYRSGFRPAAQATGVRTAEGWYRFTIEHVARLRECCYVPVLSRPVGRPRSDVVAPTPDGRVRVRAVGHDATLTIVRDYLNATEPTGVHDVAVTQGRPLAVRGPGRPPTWASRATRVRVDALLVSALALAAFVQESSSARWGLTKIPSFAELTRMLDEQCTVNPEAIARRPNFSVIDIGQLRHQAGWYLVTLSSLSLPPVDQIAVSVEIEQHRSIERMAEQSRADLTRMQATSGPAPRLDYLPDSERMAIPGKRYGAENKLPEEMTPEERDIENCLLQRDL